MRRVVQTRPLKASSAKKPSAPPPPPPPPLPPLGAAVTVTTTVLRLDVPPAPSHASVKVAVAVNAPVLSLPDVAFVPAQLPPAVQLVASVDDQVSVDDAPDATEVGLAENVLVGSAICGTVMLVGQELTGVIVATFDDASVGVIVMSAVSVSP